MRSARSFIVLTLLLIQSSLISGQSSDSILRKRYSFSFSNNTLVEMIDSIRVKTNLGFSYNPNYLSQQNKFSYSFRHYPLRAILDSIFKSSNLSYNLIGTTIAISKNISTEKPLPVVNGTHRNDSVNYLHYNGSVKDALNNDPIPFASIYIKNKPIGTISNQDGYFSLKVPKELSSDSVCFSFLGYRTKTLAASDLHTEDNEIRLTQMSIRLKEVTIRYIKPDELIQKAIERIPDNYSSTAQLATGFYRETIKQNNEYVALTEAVLKIYKAPYDSYLTDQATIYKGRKSPFVKPMDTIFFKLQGGIYTSFMLDIAKNHSSFISGDNFYQYDYKLEGTSTYQGHTLYIIAFDQKDNIQYPLYKGKIYIDTESLALVKLTFSLSPKGIDYAANVMVKKAPVGVKVRPMDASYEVGYTEQNNIWHLSHIREDIKFKIRKRFNLFNITFQSTAELAITQIDSVEAKRFKRDQTIKEKDIFTEKITSYDPDFWEDFNYIAPEKKLEEAIDELREKTAKIE
ncbi:MAG TPA: carboxypeptidase-like regulatory domain-containing protein [Bacteroidales bacterium]|nr:carboxypeptidase-like regulatory domain-containing protein [Bacteroidales bacterium]